VISTPERRRAPDPTWTSPEGEAPQVAIGPAGWAMIAWRLPLMAGGRLRRAGAAPDPSADRAPVFGLRRPVTPFVTQAVCRAVFPIMGIRLVRHGTPMRRRGALVANHCSWLDIFALNALARVCFVSKSEVATWPGIGWLARATGTVFITRNARDARLQKEVFEARLRAGHHLAFFPEGTSTDGRRVLDFKPTLFAAFFTHGLDAILSIQPVSLAYTAPPGQDPRFYGWWGGMGFGGHLLRVLAQVPQGRVEVTFHPPVPVAETADRKALARTCEAAVRAGLHAHLPPG
jgi:lyso-ornithine lipid O-acyltransferase